MLKNIRTLSLKEVEDFFLSVGEKKFRSQQVYEWLWGKNARSFEDMSNLSKELRNLLATSFSLPALKMDLTQISEDKTIKSRFKTIDGYLIEGVLIPSKNRKTACVSSQVGCSLACKFCATARMDRKRNLNFDEIYDQVTIINQQSESEFGQKLTNIVFMGMGEPLLNYKNVVQAIDRLTAVDGMQMSARRITVSTAGIANQIERLGNDKVRFNLALSLHAATDKKRNEIMPINETNTIPALITSLNYFYKQTNNDITLEYILFHRFNDSQKDAEDLIKIYRQVPVHLVNIIEYNAIDSRPTFQKSNDETTAAFLEFLAKNRVNVRLRRSRGKDISAACGQLANKK